MQKKTTKLIALLLTLIMLAGIMPAGALAVDSDSTTTPVETTVETPADTPVTTENPVQESDETPTEAPDESEPSDSDSLIVQSNEPQTLAETGTVLLGGEEITQGGNYVLDDAATGVITISTTEVVIISGSGVTWDENNAMTCTEYKNVQFNCTVEGAKITLKDAFITNSGSCDTAPLINFKGIGNTLTINGTVLLEKTGSGRGTHALIHVPVDTALTIDGTGTLYLYKSTGGSGIGGSLGELNGDITFGTEASDLTVFAKGTKQGALIGAGTSDTAGEGQVPGAIRFVQGEYNLISNSRGAAIGGSAGTAGASAGTNVYVEQKANININVDFSGAAVGGGGYAEGNDSSGGTLTVTGGSLRTYIDVNAAGNTTGWNGAGFTAGVNDAAITAQRVNDSGEAVYKLAFDTSKLATAATAFNVTMDDATNLFYSGGLHQYGYVQEALDKNEQLSITTTVSNWYKNDDTNLYFYLTGADHTVTVNGETFTYYWNDVTNTFSDVKEYHVTFATTPDDANVVVSSGIGYTYVENTFKGVAIPEVEGESSATTIFSLVPGTYTATITKDGYYASSYSFAVNTAGNVTYAGTGTTSNLTSYYSGNTFTIPLTAFVKSTNTGAWDGVTLDVSWYSESGTEFHISTPAQLAGMAAIINGIYNAEITTIIDDVDKDGVNETYTPVQYAALESRKIRAACSTGETSGPNGNNLVSSSTYWYGAKSTGAYTSGSLELQMPSDFNGMTVYIDANLDMGGYQTDGTWTGARYMSIGGQSIMHYIDYSVWKSEGNSIIGASFNGTLDGQGHIVTNIYCDRYAAGTNYGDSQSVGLVGRLGNHDSDPSTIAAVNPTVKNIAVTGYVYARRSVGGIVGKIGKTSASKLYDGSTGGIIENCLNFAQVKNTDSKGCGGIVGAGWNKGVVRSCANFGAISTTYSNPTGGISGSNEVLLTGCYNVGLISATNSRYAMAIGTNNGGASTVDNCFWLTGTAPGGGYYSGTGAIEITDNYNDTTMTAAEYMKSADMLTALNGNTRDWVFAAETDAISALTNGYPVQRIFTNDTTTVTSIAKTADPTVLEYVEGQSFSAAGLEIWATYSDSTKALVTDYSITPAGALAADVTSVIVSGTVGGQAYSYSFNITVAAKSVDKIVITSTPSNTLYAADEAFSAEGMVVKAYYTDFPTTAVTLAAEDYTYTVNGSTLTVSYTFAEKTVTDNCALVMLDTVAPTPNADGVYELASSNDLVWFANQVNYMKNTGLDALVTADITADANFKGIGRTSNYYTGTFDGGNHVITLNIDTSDAAALVADSGAGAEIKNVITAGTVKSSSNYGGIGGIIGYVNGTATVTNCINRATIIGGGYVGGIAGKVMSYPITVVNCINEGNISATSNYCGGIVGYLYYKGSSITDSINKGTVTSTSGYVGGITGYMNSSSATDNVVITNCGNNGAVTGTTQVGGVAGYSNNVNDTITGCYNVGAVTATMLPQNSGVGGILGYGKAKIIDSYNLGAIANTDCSVSDTSAAYAGVGGIVGVAYTNVISNSYNAGTTTSDGSINQSGLTKVKVGGLCGYLYMNTSTADNCYYTSGEAYGAARNTNCVLNGTYALKTETEMKALAETLGVSYNANISESYHGGYPVLTWETVPTTISGDANGDGIVDSNDAVLILRYFADSSVAIDEGAADITGDEIIDSSDAVAVMAMFAEG